MEFVHEQSVVLARANCFAARCGQSVWQQFVTSGVLEGDRNGRPAPDFTIRVRVVFQDGRRALIAQICGKQQQRIRRCILHIGTEKTGTTSLQMFLGTNRNALLQRGFFVPASLSPHAVVANHERLTVIALDPAKLGDDLRVRAGLKTIEDVKEWRVRVEEDLSREIVALSHQPENSPTLLLSNEHCHSRLVTREEVHYLRQFLDRFADETTHYCLPSPATRTRY